METRGIIFARSFADDININSFDLIPENPIDNLNKNVSLWVFYVGFFKP